MGHVFRSLSLDVGVMALGGNSRFNMLVENLQSGFADLKSLAILLRECSSMYLGFLTP